MTARLRGTDVLCVVDVDRDEHERRQQLGVGAVRDRLVVDALWGLAPGVEVPRASLPGSRVRALRRADAAGMVGGGRGVVRRWAQPPLTVALVVVQDTSWSRGVDRASRFGPYARRVLLLPRLPADPTELLLEAAYLGVGVATPGAPDVLAAAPFMPMRFTSSSWAFAEDAYAQFLDQSSSTLGNGTRTDTRPSRA